MNRIITLLFAVFSICLFTPPQAVACSCIFLETFCESLGPSAEMIYVDAIVYGRVISKDSKGMTIAVLDPIFGSNIGSSLKIRRGNGADCGVDTDFFNKNEEFIFALNQWENEEGQVTNSLSICGVTYLKVNNGFVLGKIAPGISVQNYKEFRTAVGCGIFKKLPKNPNGEISFKLFPNPASTEIVITLEEDYAEVQYMLLDMLGRMVWKGIRKEVEEGEPQLLDISQVQLQRGMYLLKLTNGVAIGFKKVIVQ